MDGSLTVGYLSTICSFTQTINKPPVYMAMMFQAAEIPRTEIPTKDHFHLAPPRLRLGGTRYEGSLQVWRDKRYDGGKPKSFESPGNAPFDLDPQRDEQICVRSRRRVSMTYLAILIGMHLASPFCTIPES